MDTHVFKFLKNNLKLELRKTDAYNNRSFKITKRKL